MVSHKRIKEILQNWGLENEKLTEIISEETGTGREMLQKEYERLKIMVEDGRGIEQFKEKD
jgi:hypothetical protein